MNEVEVRTMQIKDLRETMINNIDGLKKNDNDSAEVVETKNDKDVRIKNMFI